ncbi:hypothetical protein QQF64_005880 [Cirrhinus molitorella]|uniref:Uncharacterized protein n=2 Tax=Cirrhinus molitorella TaxID=172907 RepID=A0AA88PQ03_9TELE|nr:hypothetical protein Q8A67_011093 [Cirrhinus molitorella]
MSPLFVRNNDIAAEQLRQIGDVGIHTGLGYENRLAAALKPEIKLTAKRKARDDVGPEAGGECRDEPHILVPREQRGYAAPAAP